MKNKISTFLTILGICTSCQAEDGIRLLSPKEYDDAVKSDSTAVILDVRKASEYADGHIKGAKSLDVLDSKTFSEGVDKLDRNKTYYIYCRSGRRSHDAAMKLKTKGFKVADMKGGIIAWQEAGMPVCTDQCDK
ncbi:MAG: rhodanese-like domain-containing protein [Prevotella sp.]